MNAIIYAAGRGNRLGLNLPKCLVEVDGKPIILHQIEFIKSIADIPIYVFAGFKYDQVEALLSGVSGVKLVYNPFYDCAGINGTAWVTLPYIGDKVWRIEGDVLLTDREGVLSALNKGVTVFFKNDCTNKKTAVMQVQGENLQGCTIVDDYSGPDEWSCSEIYCNCDYEKLVNQFCQYMVSKDFYYFEAVNKAISTKVIQPQVQSLTGVFEIDNPQDLSNARLLYRSQKVLDLPETISRTFQETPKA